MLSSEKRISDSVENWTRMPPAALLVVPEPTVSRSRTKTSRSPRRARWEAIEQPTTPPPMMTSLVVPGGLMRPDYDQGDAAAAEARALAGDADVQRRAGSDTIPPGSYGRSSLRGRSSLSDPVTARPPLVPVCA